MNNTDKEREKNTIKQILHNNKMIHHVCTNSFQQNTRKDKRKK